MSNLHPTTSEYWITLNNNIKLLEKITKSKTCHCVHLHTQEPRNKETEKWILDNYSSDIFNSLKNSKFRSESNLTQQLYNDYLIITNQCTDDKDAKIKSKLKFLNSIPNMAELNKYKFVCLNDTGDSKFELRDNIYKLLLNKFPEKSSFEK